jgi:hypothetical protein
MVDVKPNDPARSRLGDLIRSLIYPTVPILGVICVWAYAYANSLESKIRRDLQSHDADSYFVVEPGPQTATLEVRQGAKPTVQVTSVDDRD